MKLVDASVLIYAVNTATRHHTASRVWLTAALSGADTIGLPWTSLLAFVRITTNPRINPSPLTAEQAMAVVESWVSRPTCVTVEPGPRHLSLLSGLLVEQGTAGNLTMDAHLAALALEHRGSVVSFDRDFARFGVEVIVPGAA